jgi:hypothetical protein
MRANREKGRKEDRAMSQIRRELRGTEKTEI